MNTLKSYFSMISKRKLYLIVYILLFSGLLVIYGFKGLYSRYSQDDYCYGYRVRAEGLWQMQIQSYLHPTEYNSNRYSLTLAHSFAELLGGPNFVPILPTLEILAWVGSFAYTFYQVSGIVGVKKNLLIAITSALTITFFSFYLAPNQYQILFWLSAMKTYLTPMVLFTFTFGRFISISKSKKISVYHIIELILLCFIAGGFSETMALWQFVIWGMALVGAVVFRKKSALIKNILKASFITSLSTLLSIIVLMICPVNFKFAFYTRPDFLTLISQPIIFGIDFVWLSFKATPLPYMVIAAFGLLLCYLTNYDQVVKPRRLIIETITILIILFILSIIVMVPAMYATAHYPGDRALFPAAVTMVICLFLLGWQAGRIINSIKPVFYSSHFLTLLMVFMGAILFAYCLRATFRVYAKMPLYQGRAEAWDIRQQMIFKAKAEGIKNVIVPAFDSVYGITELQSDPNHWVNRCVANYYGVPRITAIENYGGISAHPIGK